MTATYDILTDDGHRLLTCVHDSRGIFLQGKYGKLELLMLLEQVFNPGKAQMERAR